MIWLHKQHTSQYFLLIFMILSFIAVNGCSFAPQYQRPDQDLPTQWRNVNVGNTPLNMDWWTRFSDPVLTALISDALKRNIDLEESLAKIDSAAAQAGVATASLFPQVNAGAGASSDSSSMRAPNSMNTPLYARSTTNYQGGLNASWEIDLWGKLRNNRTMLCDVLMNTVIGHEGLRLSVAAQTAQTYFSLLALDMQLETAKRTLKSREESLKIYTSRYEQGDITELDWLRAKSEVEIARAQVHTSTISVEQAETALAVLTGWTPREIMERAMPRGRSIDSMPAPPVIPSGLPSELLMRRPDIRAAEFLIMAYNANIGVARAQFFPSISLTGMLGTLSSSVSFLFDSLSGAWSYGISATMPLLDFGKNWYNLKDAEAQKQASIATYRKTVQNAFKDIRDSLTSQRESVAVVKSIQAEVDNLKKATELARLQYDNGYTDYLTVLDAERQLFSAELSLASAMRDRLNSVVQVCMALGGGWQDSGSTPDFPIINTEKILKEEKYAPQVNTPKR